MKSTLGALIIIFIGHFIALGQNEIITSETGIASYYSDMLHGNLTANGERYNRYSFTGAHKTLPFGSKVIVTNLSNDKSVVVTINDRGPFVEGRIIDLSHAAAQSIDLLQPGIIQVRLDVIEESNSINTDHSHLTHPEELSKLEEERLLKDTVQITASVVEESKNTVIVEVDSFDIVADTLGHLVGHIYASDDHEVLPGGYGVQVSATSSFNNALAYSKRLEAEGFHPVFVEAANVRHSHVFRVIVGNYATRMQADYAHNKYLEKGLNGFVKQHAAHP